jgi:acetyl esterase/lipase
MKHLSLILFSFVMILSCTKRDLNDSWQTPVLAAETRANVAYGADVFQKMDVYLPEGRNVDSTKVIVLIHGGAWIEGDKADFAAQMDTLKKRLPGYALVNVNYRLASATANHFPAQEQDIKAALTYLSDHRMEYRLSDKWVLLGASAGGHLALLQAYKYAAPIRPKAVVSFFGPTDMAGMYNAQTTNLTILGMQLLMNGTPASNPVNYQQTSPITFAGPQSMPTLLLHGGVDDIVPVAQSTSLRDKLVANSIPVEYYFFPTEGHGIWSPANTSIAYNKVEAFIRLYAK